MNTQESLNLFKSKLLSTSSAPYIVKIIHFGSTLKGNASPESDVDVLVISSNGEATRNAVADVSFSMQMDYRVPIEPIIEDVDNLIVPTSYFLYNVLRYGKEVYTMEKDDIKKEARKNLVQLAKEYLGGAEDAKKRNSFRLAVDAGYNAAELAVKALLLKKIDDLPGSHGGLVGRFGELYVKTQEMPEELGRKLNRALELRNSARYKYQAIIGKDDAESVLELAKLIIKKSD